MKLKKLLCTVLIILGSSNFYAQVVITEIYHDTPYPERYDGRSPQSGPHHLGEFIELYNYTTEDIPLKGWSITDRVSKYIFPDNAIIRSESFIVVAYRDLYYGPDTGDYFTLYFPTTQGKEDQIYYQGNVMLRNRLEEVHLNMGSIRGVNFNQYRIFENEWYNASPPPSNEDQAYDDLPNMNYYVSSYQLASNGTFHFATANPLDANYVPPTQRLEEITAFQDALLLNYANYTWDYYSNLLLNMSCPLVISTIEQPVTGIYLDNSICFDYDISGNNISSHECASDEDQTNPNTGLYTAAEIEDISSKIIIYPNPTTGIINITWDNTVNGKITQVEVSNFGGVSIGNVSISSSATSTVFDITNQPATIYITTFTLNTGQLISKNVIKN